MLRTRRCCQGQLPFCVTGRPKDLGAFVKSTCLACSRPTLSLSLTQGWANSCWGRLPTHCAILQLYCHLNSLLLPTCLWLNNHSVYLPSPSTQHLIHLTNIFLAFTQKGQSSVTEGWVREREKWIGMEWHRVRYKLRFLRAFGPKCAMKSCPNFVAINVTEPIPCLKKHLPLSCDLCCCLFK